MADLQCRCPQCGRLLATANGSAVKLSAVCQACRIRVTHHAVGLVNVEEDALGQTIGLELRGVLTREAQP